MTKVKKKLRLKISKITILIFLLDILFVDALVFINTEKFKTFWIPTAMTTMSHKYLAYTLYDEDTVNSVMSANYIEQSTEDVDLDAITIKDNSGKKHYSNKYEKELFNKDPGNDVYKMIRLEESKYKGYLVAIYDPGDVELAVSSRLGKMGENVSKIIQDGKLIWNHSGGSKQLIGMTKDNKLWLTGLTPEEAIAKGMEDAIEFGPDLIVNGKVAKIHGDGGWGVAPRSVIAQRQDGVVLFLIIEGRLPGYSVGASMNDVIEILLRYKAYNAANLDGGASSTMSVEGKLWNKPSAGESYGGRTVSNAWIVTNKNNKPAQAPVK